MANPSPEELLEARLNGPAMAPPPGLYTNFIDPLNLHVYGIITLVFCMTFSTVAVLVRMYTKIFLLRKVLLEDCQSAKSSLLLNTRHPNWFSSDTIILGYVRSLILIVSLLSLNSAAIRNCGGRSVYYDDKIWCRDSSVECTAQNVLRHAICMRRHQSLGDKDQLNNFPVGWHIGNTLRSDRIFHQTLYSPPVPQNVRSKPQSQHVHIRWSPRNPMAHLDILSHTHLLHDFHMQSTRESLESVYTKRTLLWFYGHFQVYRNIQCDFRFRNLNPSN